MCVLVGVCTCTGQRCNTLMLTTHRIAWAHYYSCHNSLAVEAAGKQANHCIMLNSHTNELCCSLLVCLNLRCVCSCVCFLLLRTVYLVFFHAFAWAGTAFRLYAMHHPAKPSIYASRSCVWVTAWHIASLTLALRSPVPLLCVRQVVKHPSLSMLLFCCGAMSLIELSAALPALAALW